jgi:hypothetical protein
MYNIWMYSYLIEENHTTLKRWGHLRLKHYFFCDSESILGMPKHWGRDLKMCFRSRVILTPLVLHFWSWKPVNPALRMSDPMPSAGQLNSSVFFPQSNPRSLPVSRWIHCSTQSACFPSNDRIAYEDLSDANARPSVLNSTGITTRPGHVSAHQFWEAIRIRPLSRKAGVWRISFCVCNFTWLAQTFAKCAVSLQQKFPATNIIDIRYIP